FHRDSEPLEGLVDFLVDVRLLLGRVLDAVSRFVEVAPGSPGMERRVHRILPVRRVGVLVRILRIPLRGTEASVPFSAWFHGAGHPMGTADSAIKGSRSSPGAGPSRKMINGDSIEGSMPPRRVTIVDSGIPQPRELPRSFRRSRPRRTGRGIRRANTRIG